jgi:hypothetical protein
MNQLPIRTFRPLDVYPNHRAGDLAFFDQIDAENRQAEDLAPHNRRLLRDPGIRVTVNRADERADLDAGLGPVPVVRTVLHEVSTHERTGSAPILGNNVVTYCGRCSEATAPRTPFWIARGSMIVQIDLCNDCALWAVLSEFAVPQFHFEPAL